MENVAISVFERPLFAVHCGAKVQCIVGSLLSGYCVPLRLPHQYAWRSTDVCVEELDAMPKSFAFTSAVITAESIGPGLGLHSRPYGCAC